MVCLKFKFVGNGSFGVFRRKLRIDELSDEVYPDDESGDKRGDGDAYSDDDDEEYPDDDNGDDGDDVKYPDDDDDDREADLLAKFRPCWVNNRVSLRSRFVGNQSFGLWCDKRLRVVECDDGMTGLIRRRVWGTSW